MRSSLIFKTSLMLSLCLRDQCRELQAGENQSDGRRRPCSTDMLQFCSLSLTLSDFHSAPSCIYHNALQ